MMSRRLRLFGLLLARISLWLGGKYLDREPHFAILD
jgi:hypothetical protein